MLWYNIYNMPTPPKSPSAKHPETTVLWLGFVAIIAIVATQLITDKLNLSSDIALLPPMSVALVSLVIILSVSSRLHRMRDKEESDATRTAELLSLREEYNYIASKTIASASTAIKWGLRSLEPTLFPRLEESEKAIFEHIRERNDTNLEILRNLGLLSRIDQRVITPHAADTDLRDVLHDIVSITERATAAKGTSLVYVPPQVPVIARVDRIIAGDIVQSLYYYCLSRTRGKGDALTVRCFTSPDESGVQRSRIIIADNAPAVPINEREHLFDRVIKDSTTGATTSVNLGPHTAKLLSEVIDISLVATVTDDQTAFTLTF